MCVASCRALMFAKMRNVSFPVWMPAPLTWKKCIFSYPVVLCHQVASLCFYPDRRMLLRFTQTLPSDLAVAKDQEEASHCLPPLSAPPSRHRPPYMGCGRRCPGWSFLSRSHHSWSSCCQRGDGLPHMEKGVGLFCPPFLYTVIGVINWTTVPLQYPPPGSLTHTVKIQRLVLIWWVAPTEGWLTLKKGKRQEIFGQIL